MPEVRVVLHQPRPRQPEDLLQRDRQRGRQQLRRRVRQAAKTTTRPTRRAMLDELRRELKKYPNARIYVREFQNGPPITRADRDSRHRAGSGRAARAGGARSRRSSRRRRARATSRTRCACARTNLSLDIDSQKAALLGVPAVEFDRAVRLAVAGIPAGPLQGHATASSTTSWCARRSTRVPTCARSIRCASRR